jgi:hypothetical protein
MKRVVAAASAIETDEETGETTYTHPMEGGCIQEPMKSFDPKKLWAVDMITQHSDEDEDETKDEEADKRCFVCKEEFEQDQPQATCYFCGVFMHSNCCPATSASDKQICPRQFCQTAQRRVAQEVSLVLSAAKAKATATVTKQIHAKPAVAAPKNQGLLEVVESSGVVAQPSEPSAAASQDSSQDP